jgi:endonuclease/exonuclease/phosphatase family metal-dependent hydrolase
VVLFIIGYNNLRATFGIHIFAKSFDINKKDTSTIRIMQLNTMSLGEYERDRVKGTELREKIFNYIKENDADILCFQEFFDAYHREFNQNINFIVRNLGYPNYYFSRDFDKIGVTKDSGHKYIGYWGTIIFTKLPIVDTGKIKLISDLPKSENMAFIDVLKNGKRIKVLSAHLQSIRLKKSDYAQIDKFRKGEETDITTSKGIVNKIVSAYSYRVEQVQTIKQVLDTSKMPTILTGDFNDIPNSYTYSVLSKNMKDAFLQTGFGIGQTFSSILPILRIDYILASKDFKVLQSKRQKINLSDHYPVVADVSLNEM